MSGGRGREPRFTVVLNTYNRADVLPRAVASVLAQSEHDFELVVVDDGSTDGTAEVVAGFDDARVRYIRRDNGGLAAARNTGIAEARGTYVTFLDDDDEATPRWLDRFASRIDHEGAAVVCCGFEARARDGSRTVRLPAPLGAAFDDHVGLFMAGTFAVRREALEAIGGFLPELRCSEQTELSLRLVRWCRAHGARVAVVDEPLLVVHRERDEARPLRRADFLHDGALLVLDRHGDRLRRSPVLYADFLAVAAVQGARMGRFAEARHLLWRAVRARPTDPKHWARLALAAAPPAGRRVWGTWSPPEPRS